MSAATETDILAGLDFTPALPCEHSEHKTRPRLHEGDAAWVVSIACSSCPATKTYLICDRGLRVIRLGATCADCGTQSSVIVLAFRPIGDMP